MSDYKHEVRRPTDYNNGQIWGWNGGECPVHPETVVKTWRRLGGCEPNLPAKKMEWGHLKHCGDIIAFQVVKAYVEPKVIWVNEYNTGFYSPYLTKEEAVKMANKPQATRIAVKYQEVKE